MGEALPEQAALQHRRHGRRSGGGRALRPARAMTMTALVEDWRRRTEAPVED
jgi:hypothetical protein